MGYRAAMCSDECECADGVPRALYQFFQNQGCTNVAIDSTSLNMGHSSSGIMFVIALMSEFNSL